MEEENTVVNEGEQQPAADDAQQMQTGEEKSAAPQNVPNGTVDHSGDDDPQDGREQAKDFSAALKKREEAIERKFQARYAKDSALASSIRRRYDGKTDKEISDSLDGDRVSEFAKENGVSEGLARMLLKIESGLSEGRKDTSEIDAIREGNSEPDARMQTLAEQVEYIKGNYGFDMIEYLKSGTDDAEAARQGIADGKMDVERAYIAYLSSRTAKAPTVSRNTGVGRGEPDFLRMSKKELSEYAKRVNW